MWKTLHYVALGFPESPSTTDVANYRAFFTGLHEVIPCQVCADNYRRHLREVPIDGFLGGPSRLFEWTVIMHNTVNREKGKRELGVGEAYALYASGMAAETGASASTTASHQQPGDPTTVFVLTVVLLIASAIGFALGAWIVGRSKK